MRLEVNIEKRYAYVIITLLIVLIGVLVVGAYTGAIPNPGHGGDAILVKVGGAEKTLQAAIDAGEFSEGGELTGVDLADCYWTNPSHNYCASGPYGAVEQELQCSDGYITVGLAVLNDVCGNTDDDGAKLKCCKLI